MEYDVERTVAAPVERTWQVASDVQRFPDWVPGISAAAQPAADAVDVQLEEREVVGLLRVDEDQRRVEWGSRGTSAYAGWLQVAGGDGVSSLHLHLSFDDDAVEAGEVPTVGDGDVDAALREALDAFAAIVETP